MPFEIAEKTEQEQRVALGRIAMEAIAAHILTVPPENFKMITWCGTAQCAIGHGCALPEVRATGLYMSKRGFPSFGDNEEGFDSHVNISAAFGIPQETSGYLFRMDDRDNSREGISKKIRAYLAATA